MQRCDSSGDCRGGYACEDVSGVNDLGATLIQKNPETTKICVVASSLPSIDENESSDQVCAPVERQDAGGAGGAGGATQQ